MEKQQQANEDGAGTGSEEAAASAADVGKKIEEGSVASMDDYMKAVEPGVSRQSDPASAKATADKQEEETTEGTENAEESGEEETTEDTETTESEESEEEEAAEQEEEHGSGLRALGLNDEQEKAVGKIIERRVAKPVAQRKAAEERADQLQEQLEELQEQLEELQERLDQAGGDAPQIMLAETEAEVDRYESRLKSGLRELRRWVDDHDREDVYTVKREDGDDLEFSWAEVRQRQYLLEDELSDLVPKARKAVAKRLKAVGEAKEKYPKLFDRSSEEHTRMQSILREAPQLKTLPNYYILIGRMLAGEQLKTAPSAPPKPTAAKPPETSAPNKTKTASAQPGINRDAKTMDEYMGIKT